MKLNKFLNLYDDWNRTIRINDDSLNTIIETNILNIVENKRNLLRLKVISFGFYDNLLTVRLKNNRNGE